MYGPAIERPAGPKTKLRLRMGQKVFLSNDKLYVVATVCDVAFNCERQWEVSLQIGPQPDLEHLIRDISLGFLDVTLVSRKLNFHARVFMHSTNDRWMDVWIRGY